MRRRRHSRNQSLIRILVMMLVLLLLGLVVVVVAWVVIVEVASVSDSRKRMSATTTTTCSGGACKMKVWESSIIMRIKLYFLIGERTLSQHSNLSEVRTSGFSFQAPTKGERVMMRDEEDREICTSLLLLGSHKKDRRGTGGAWQTRLPVSENRYDWQTQNKKCWTSMSLTNDHAPSDVYLSFSNIKDTRS